MLTIYCCEEIFSEEIVFKRKFICVWLVIFYVQRTFIKILGKMSYINPWLFTRWINWFHFARSKFWNRWYKQWASIFYQRHNCCNVFLLTKERWNERSEKIEKTRIISSRNSILVIFPYCEFRWYFRFVINLRFLRCNVCPSLFRLLTRRGSNIKYTPHHLEGKKFNKF